MKTSELTGAALDWAVAEIEWIAHDSETNVLMVTVGDDNGWKFKPSSDWSQGGPIIEREKMRMAYNFDEHIWEAGWDCHVKGWGDTPLIAAMRCFVASKLGDEVDVPLAEQMEE
jgi:hypothetical protein